MRCRNVTLLLSMALLIGLTACSTSGEAEADESTEQAKQTQQQTDHHDDQQQTDTQHKGDGDKHQKMAKMCPMKVEGTTRQVVELDEAVAMDFTTSGDVDELRQRVQKMAQMHEKKHGKQDEMQHGKMHGQMTEEQRQMRKQMMQMMSDASVTTEEIDSGMRMKFTPKDPAQVDELYEMMNEHSRMMEENNGCPMMHMRGGESADEKSE